MEAQKDQGRHALVLDSWKAIAAHLERDVSTVQRWEHARGLPVHRLPGGKKGGVYALTSELDTWRNAGRPAEETGARKPILKWIGAAAVLGVGLAASLWWTGPASHEPVAFRFKPLMSLPGEEADPAFSTNGTQLAFSYRPEGESSFDLYVKVAGKMEPLRLTETPEDERHPQWSPDGRQIAFLKRSADGVEIWLVSATGGGERRVSPAGWPATLGETRVAWTKSGGSLVVPGRESPDEPEGLYLLELATGKRRRLTLPPAGSIGDAFPQFSPDWKQLAFLRQAPSRIHEIWVMDANEPRSERPVNTDGFGISGLAWSWSGHSLLYVSTRGGPDPAVWMLDPRGGRPKLVTVLPVNSRGLTVSAETDAIAFTQNEAKSSIWRYDLTASRREPERLIKSNGVQAMPRFSPDGRSIAFMSDRAGGFELWVSDADGNHARRLTDLRGEGGSPRWSPDGNRIAFDVRKGGLHRILTVSATGGAPVELVGDRFENGAPSWSVDGRWVYFCSSRSGKAQIWRVRAQGGEPEQITWNGGTIAYEAPGGQEIFFAGPREKQGIFRQKLGSRQEDLAVPRYRLGYRGMWQLTDAGICYLELDEGQEDGHPTLRLQPYRGAAKTLAILPSRATPHGYAGGLTLWHPLSISPDGRSLLLTQLDQRLSTIMLADRAGQ